MNIDCDRQKKKYGFRCIVVAFGAAARKYALQHSLIKSHACVWMLTISSFRNSINSKQKYTADDGSEAEAI